MKKPLFFDTLEYAESLDKAGVKQAKVFSKALNRALGKNINSKSENKVMIEKTENKLNGSVKDAMQKSENAYLDLRRYIKTVETRLETKIEKAVNRNLITTVSILGTLIIMMGTITSISYHFVR